MKKFIIFIFVLILLSGCSVEEEETVLDLGIMIHIEGWTEEPSIESQFIDHAETVRNFATILEDGGLRGTFEVRTEFIQASKNWDDNVILELYERGHGIGVHADWGGNLERDNLDQELFAHKLTVLKNELEDLIGLEVRHVSGICSELDWVEAAIDVGYEFTTGGVAFCVMSMPEENRPEEFKDCENPGACHDAFPVDLEDRIHPWRVSSGDNWIENDPDGELVYFPSDNIFRGFSEEQKGDLSNIEFDEEHIYIPNFELELDNIDI